MTSYVHSSTDPVILYWLHLSAFRTPEKESISKAVLQKSRGRSQLWAHSKEPLKQPLLKTACTDPDLRDLACQAFIDILSLFSLGPENTQGEEELPTSTKLTSIEIILHPHYRGYFTSRWGVSALHDLTLFPLSTKERFLYSCSTTPDGSLNWECGFRSEWDLWHMPRASS